MMQVETSSPCSSSAVFISDHEYLLTEILVLLPVKSLVRFKSVSRHWHSLISDESFSRLHVLSHNRRHSETQHSFILSVRDSSHEFYIFHPTVRKLARFPLPFAYKYVKILQSCNGLLLLQCRKNQKRSRGGNNGSYYYVFNPTTKKYRNFHKSEFPVTLCLIFDPSKSEHYKIVALWEDISSYAICYSVYDSATHEWKDHRESYSVGFRFPSGMSCNRRAYFIRKSKPSFYYCPEKKLCINIPSPQRRGEKRYVVESNGHLHCVCISSGGFHVSEMIGDKWFTRKSDVWSHQRSCITQLWSKIELLGMIREERVEDSKVLVHMPGHIMIYRFCDHEFEVVVNYRSDCFCENGGLELELEFKDAYPFIGSFASV